MNRPIRFRAWDNSKKEMLYPKKAEDMTDKITSASLLAAYNDGGLDAIMQSTGLFDKNGKEIWEGDVLNHDKYSTEFKEGDVGIVEVETLQQFFEDRGLYTQEYGEEWDAENFEIIGNIYENKELIK